MTQEAIQILSIIPAPAPYKDKGDYVVQVQYRSYKDGAPSTQHKTHLVTTKWYLSFLKYVEQYFQRKEQAVLRCDYPLFRYKKHDFLAPTLPDVSQPAFDFRTGQIIFPSDLLEVEALDF